MERRRAPSQRGGPDKKDCLKTKLKTQRASFSPPLYKKKADFSSLLQFGGAFLSPSCFVVVNCFFFSHSWLNFLLRSQRTKEHFCPDKQGINDVWFLWALFFFHFLTRAFLRGGFVLSVDAALFSVDVTEAKVDHCSGLSALHL